VLAAHAFGEVEGGTLGEGVEFRSLLHILIIASLNPWRGQEGNLVVGPAAAWWGLWAGWFPRASH
jgi:hypothetical protein